MRNDRGIGNRAEKPGGPQRSRKAISLHGVQPLQLLNRTELASFSGGHCPPSQADSELGMLPITRSACGSAKAHMQTPHPMAGARVSRAPPGHAPRQYPAMRHDRLPIANIPCARTRCAVPLSFPRRKALPLIQYPFLSRTDSVGYASGPTASTLIPPGLLIKSSPSATLPFPPAPYCPANDGAPYRPAGMAIEGVERRGLGGEWVRYAVRIIGGEGQCGPMVRVGGGSMRVYALNGG